MTNIYQTIVDQSPISIVITDLEGNIEYVNPKFIEITGYKAEEVIGKTPKIFKSEQANMVQYERIGEIVRSGEVWKGEMINKRKNGELYTEFAVVSPIKDENGNFTKLISMKEDITELKKIQEELQRTEKFKGLMKMASYISHEIKSPLTSIKANIDMVLRKTLLPDYANKSLCIAQCEITRLCNLLKNIIEYSKKEEVSFTSIYLPEFVQALNDIFEPQLEEKRIKFINNVTEHRVLGDIEKLKTVFILLIENSIAAVPEKGTIEVSSFSENGMCSIYIKDNGCGIENKERAFEPFFTTKEYGTGLGLTIAKDIMERQNGEIKLASSKPGETIFKLIIKMES